MQFLPYKRSLLKSAVVLRMKLHRLLTTICQFSAGVTIGICGLILIYSWSLIMDSFLVLRPNSILYKYWSRIPIDIPTDFHFFNWTNPQDIYNLSTKPAFKELGPYRFWQKEEKTNVTWNDNGTVTFRQQKYWHYDESAPNGDLDDVVVTADTLTLTAAYVLRNWNYYIRKAVFVTLSGRFPVLNRAQTVRELLFEGYQEPLIKVAAALPFFSHLNLPQWDKFGWLYQRNGSSEFDGIFNMGTGINSVLGKIHQWNYQNRTPYFEGSCADVFGSAGQIYPRNLNKTSISLYSSDLRRSAHLTFVKEEVVGGILGYKYAVDESVLDNGTHSPENSCFCNGECVPSGMVNLSNTRHGSPLFISLPHYYLADPYYLNTVDGLKPERSKHNFSMVIEPMTGIPLRAHAKIQVNLLVQPISGISLFEKVPRFFLPVVWTEQSYEIKGFQWFLIKLLTMVPMICMTVGTLMVIGSIIFIFILLYVKYYRHIRRRPVIQFFEEQHIPLNAHIEAKD